MKENSSKNNSTNNSLLSAPIKRRLRLPLILSGLLALTLLFIIYFSEDGNAASNTKEEQQTIQNDFSKKYDSFKVGELWYDTNGNLINAHGGGMFYFHNTYYWVGEKRDQSASEGVSIYSSKDLHNWKDEGTALAMQEDTLSDIAKGAKIERPKIVYNEHTKQFVMWFHLELSGKGYSAARAGVAVSKSPAGPYKFIKSFRPNGNMSRDMTLYVDDNSNAYLIYSSRDNYDMRIVQLSPDYLSTTKKDSLIASDHREAPAIFRYHKKYYLVTSACTGWDPNEANLYVSKSLFGPWKKAGNPMTGKDANLTFYAQSSFIFPVQGKKNAFIFMADKWNPNDLKDSRYIWLPVQFKNDKPFIEWKDDWDLHSFDIRQ